MEFAMIGFPPPHRTCETLHIFDISIYIYIYYIHIYSFVCASVADTRNETIPDKQGSQRCDFPLPMSFRNWFTFGSSPLRQRRDRERFFFGNTRWYKELHTYRWLPTSMWLPKKFLFYLFTSSFLRLHQPTRDRSLKFWNLPPLKHHILCVLTTSKGTSIHVIHLIDRRNMGSHKGHFHKFGF